MTIIRADGATYHLKPAGYDDDGAIAYEGAQSQQATHSEADMVTFPQTGGCHCGSVRYQITAEPLVVYTCHCTDCQHFTASAFSMGIVVTEDAFQFERSGQALWVIKSIADSGRIKQRYICIDCGNWICGPARPDPYDETRVIRVVRGGTLNDTSWLKPTIHFWTRSKQPWVILPEGDQQHETQPT